MSSTIDVRKKFDLYRQYDVYEPWLKENGFTLNDLPLSAKTDCGEDVIIEAERDDDGNIIWKISTFQDNGWLRINRYHNDGTVEESYEK